MSSRSIPLTSTLPTMFSIWLVVILSPGPWKKSSGRAEAQRWFPVKVGLNLACPLYLLPLYMAFTFPVGLFFLTIVVLIIIGSTLLCVCVYRVCNLEKSGQRFHDSSLLDNLRTEDGSQSTLLQRHCVPILTDLAVRGEASDHVVKCQEGCCSHAFQPISSFSILAHG